MKVSKILIKGFQQFENFQLDLTNPETGEPLDKICLIGPNGTGKTTILNFVLWVLRYLSEMPFPDHNSLGNDNSDTWLSTFYQSISEPIDITNRAFLGIEFDVSGERFFVRIAPTESDPQRISLIIYQGVLEDNNRSKVEPIPCSNLHGSEDLIIYEPADQSMAMIHGLPNTSASQALLLSQRFPVFHTVGVVTAPSFWNNLIYLMSQRRDRLIQFIEQSDNDNRPTAEVRAEFNRQEPEILPELARLWNRILHRCNLELDVDNAIFPVQFNDNLKVYIRSKITHQKLLYNKLSSGIRNYIFKLGYIKSLYFNRQIKRGFLLIDEPENCLYPDLLYDLMDDYWSIIENTQTFVSTHSPIIAAQFEPYERFHLDFDDRGYVTATRGVSPAGDDPNDLLYRDFQVRSIYGKKGLEKWERFRALRQLIQQAEDPTQKEALMAEYAEIANAYNFPVPR